MAKKHYFFSDVHLGVKPSIEEKEREKKLVGFLEAIRGDAEKLYIVGDLFDCWIEYRKVVPKGYFRTLAKLNEMSEQGVEIHFFSGNHDFWLNTYLRDEVGMILHYNEFATEIGGKRFYIIHGDGLSKGDLGYKIIKKILRSRINQFLYSLIHPDLGVWLAQKSSTTSRYHNPEFPGRGSLGMKNFAEEKIKAGFDYVIMGHFHKPQNILIEGPGYSGHYITLGDWMRHFTYGGYSPDGKFELRKYS
ncbi:MAG TPA: UDP-2,3-diacylglucosamine diphosphatase [Ignavibacteria bacterium]